MMPLSNLRILQYARVLLLMQLLGSGFFEYDIASKESFSTWVIGMGALLLLGSISFLLVLTYWSDAAPNRYLRLVNPTERGHPLTVLVLAHLLFSIIVCF